MKNDNDRFQRQFLMDAIWNLTKEMDGSFTMTISETDAISIDNCETAALRTSYEAIRDALSEHLSEASKKKPSKKPKHK